MYSLYEGQSDNTSKDAVKPAVNSDVFADKGPVDATLTRQNPMGGTLPSVDPVNVPAEGEIPMFETPNQVIPMGGTVAAIDPAKTELRDEAIPMYDAPVDQPQTNWNPAEVHPMNREMAADSIPMYETPVKDISLTETEPVVDKVHDTIPYSAPTGTGVPPVTPLLNNDESTKFRTHWNEIQAKFVDEPKTAVQQADALVTEVIAQITQTFTNERTMMEGKWNQNNDVTTEELRKSLQLYRSFFNRLVV